MIAQVTMSCMSGAHDDEQVAIAPRGARFSWLDFSLHYADGPWIAPHITNVVRVTLRGRARRRAPAHCRFYWDGRDLGACSGSRGQSCTVAGGRLCLAG